MANFRTEITADPSQYNAAMEAAAAKAMSTGQAIASNMRAGAVQMADSVRQANDRMNTSFDGVKANVERVRGLMANVAAVVGGGALFGRAINQSAEMTSETMKLARTMGTASQEASVLRIALDEINVGVDDYVGMAAKMVTKLRENEERFNQLGVTTRDTNGNLLDTQTIMGNAARALEGFKVGTDRNLAASEMFGRGWQDVMKLIRLTPELMEQARIKAEELQISVGPAGAERTRQYKLALNDVKEVAMALANRVAQAVMPALTDFGQWMTSVGPTAVQVMRGAIGGLMTLFYAVRNGLVVIMETSLATVKFFAEPILALVQAAALALEGRWGEAGDRLKSVPQRMDAAWQDAFASIMKSGDVTRERIEALFSPTAEQGTGVKRTGGTRGYTPPADKGQSRMGTWEAELAAQRDAYDRQKLEEGSFQQFTLAMERDFWKAKLTQQDLSAAERASVAKKYYDAERDIRKQAFEAEMADMKLQLEAFKKGSVERIAIAGDAAVKIGQRYGLESKEYKAALEEMARLARERAEQEQRLLEISLEAERSYQLSRVELEQQNLETLEKLGIITGKQKIERLKELKDIEFAIELKAAEERAALLEADVVAHAQALQRIAELKQKHELDKKKLDDAAALETKKAVDRWLDPIGNATQQMVNGVLQGTQTAQQLARNMLQNLALSYAQTLVKMGIDHVKSEVLKTQATTAGVAARTAAEETGAAQSTLIQAGTAIQNIGTKAWEAAANVYTAISEIPGVGPFLAPAMAAAASVAVLGFAKNVMSAAGGYDIPAGVNPMTQLHEKEMVLPARIAEPLRQSLEAGGGIGGGGNVHFHVTAMDARGVAQFFRRNQVEMADAGRAMARRFLSKG